MKAFYRTTSLLCVFLVIFVLFSGIAGAEDNYGGAPATDYPVSSASAIAYDSPVAPAIADNSPVINLGHCVWNYSYTY